jgi:pimeloyl-ACP methyl ester carboxylesterase
VRALKHILTLLVLLSCISFAQAVPGQLVSQRLLKSLSQQEMKAFFKEHKIPSVMLPTHRGLSVYEVIYKTLYADSTEVRASGLLYVPTGTAEAMPVLIYNHGTEICQERTFQGVGEQSICLAFATDGYIVLCPDYVGVGQGDRTQLYVHAPTEAGASVDMLIAVDSLLPQLGAARSKQLFISGYSQGGHAAMATHRLLQQQYADRYPVTASSPMSGPYDIESTVYNERNKRYDYPGYLMFLLKSYYECNGAYQKMQNALKEPYSAVIPSLMDGSYPMEVINSTLPDTAFRAVKDEFFLDFERNKESAFRKYLAENNVYDWKPEAPVELCYCKGDEQVTYQNSLTAYKTMRANGSTKVELWRAGTKFKHVNCALFAVIYTKMFFDGFVHGHSGSHGPLGKRLLLNIGKLAVRP